MVEGFVFKVSFVECALFNAKSALKEYADGVVRHKWWVLNICHSFLEQNKRLKEVEEALNQIRDIAQDKMITG